MEIKLKVDGAQLSDEVRDANNGSSASIPAEFGRLAPCDTRVTPHGQGECIPTRSNDGLESPDTDRYPRCGCHARTTTIDADVLAYCRSGSTVPAHRPTNQIRAR